MVLVDHEYLTGHNLQVDPVRVISFSLSLSLVRFLLSRSPSVSHPSTLLLARAFRSAGFFRSFVERHGSVYDIAVSARFARRQRSRKTTAS